MANNVEIISAMLGWLRAHWGALAAVAVCGAYFAFYVILARERRMTADSGRVRPEKDC
jgi:protein-S-isoprenylcysteine O-methyltransferase Ste14